MVEVVWRVRVEKRAGHIKKVLAFMEAGQYIGEMAPLIDAPRTASAEAVEDCRLAVIDRDRFHDLLRNSEEVSLFMLREFSNRIKHTNEVLEETTQSWIRLMVTLYYLKMWSPSGLTDEHKDLSELTGKEPGELEDVLEDLSREGILIIKDDRVIAFDEQKAWQALIGKQSRH